MRENELTEIQSVGLFRTEDHRYFWGDGTTVVGPLVSITTAMKSIDKPAIVGWAKRYTSEMAIRNLDLLHKTVELGGEQAGIDFLKKLADRKRDKAADLGTRVHALAEALARKQEVQIAEEELPYVQGFQRFEAEWQPRYTAAEYMVAHLTYAYGGTGDGVALVAGARVRETFKCEHNECRVRFDAKTTAVDATGKISGPYSETGLQLAAANFAEFSGRPGDPKKYAVPRADHHAVLHLRSDGSYAFVPYKVTPTTFAAFLAAKALWEWLQGEAKQIVGKPITEMEAAA